MKYMYSFGRCNKACYKISTVPTFNSCTKCVVNPGMIHARLSASFLGMGAWMTSNTCNVTKQVSGHSLPLTKRYVDTYANNHMLTVCVYLFPLVIHNNNICIEYDF